MKLALVVFVALAVAAPAAGAVPDGFRESFRLSPRASAIAGNPAMIYCARTAVAWSNFIQERAGESGTSIVSGLTDIEARVTYLPPSGCLPLERWLRGKRPGWFALGVAAQTFAHEAMHLRGIQDEAVAECQAMRRLPRILRYQFGIKRAKIRRLVMTEARYWHSRVPAEYRVVC